jgi:hypothetical protein
VQGKINKQISYQLGAAVRTIKAHRHRIVEKLGVQSLAELVSIAERLGRRGGDNLVVRANFDQNPEQPEVANVRVSRGLRSFLPSRPRLRIFESYKPSERHRDTDTTDDPRGAALVYRHES